MLCALHAQEATREFFDVVHNAWFPICEECYPLFLKLARDSDVVYALIPSEIQSQMAYIPSDRRFRPLIR